MKTNLIASFTMLATLWMSGCTSLDSTMLTRDESNSTWTRHPHLHGVPITLKVPTHLKIYVYEKHLLQRTTVGGINRVRRVKLPFPMRDFAQEFIFDEKIFTVDFKRPAAGAYNLNINMMNDQYIQEVKHDITDDTIARVGDLIDKIAPDLFAFPNPESETSAEPVARIGGEVLPEIKSVVAVGIFEIDAPDFERQITEFINCHLNNSHDAWIVAPHVESINRTGISGSFHDSDICRDADFETSVLPSGTLIISAPEPATKTIYEN